ncbi:MAG: SDR family oxidoreductase, partial [Gammaproteobacteria bacterium]|nr:SDR family oxidoreductase [Gammaproteobacteria bacterium]
MARLRERGMRVVATDRALAEIPCGAPLTVASLDVTDEVAIAAVVARVLGELGRLDHVVHLAGVAGRGPLAEVSREAWQQVLDTNLTSAF